MAINNNYTVDTSRFEMIRLVHNIYFSDVACKYDKGSSPTRSAELTTNVAVPRIEPVQRFFSELPKKRCSQTSLVHQRVFFWEYRLYK